MTDIERFDAMAEEIRGIVQQKPTVTNELLGVVAMALTSVVIVMEQIRDQGEDK